MIELFSLSLMVETSQAEICRSWRFSKGVGHFERKFQMEVGVSHQPLLVSETYDDCRFVLYQNIRSASFGFVTKHTTSCGRQTDGQNYDSQERNYERCFRFSVCPCPRPWTLSRN